MISVPLQIRFADCDIAGHIHNAVYLHYFESGRMQFFVSELEDNWDWKTQGIIVKKNEIEYQTPGQLTDTLRVQVSCIDIGNRSFTLSYIIINEKDEIRAEGNSVLVCMDYTVKKTIHIPKALRDILKKHLNS
jgi:acyl-CoA thioester hydrolase